MEKKIPLSLAASHIYGLLDMPYQKAWAHYFSLLLISNEGNLQ